MDKILRRVWDRVESAKAVDDYQYFMALLEVGEFLIRVTVVAYVNCINDDPDKHRDRYLYDLVEADSFGKWVNTLHNAVSNVPGRLLSKKLLEIRKEINGKSNKSWQYTIANQVQEVLHVVTGSPEKRRQKASLLEFFQDFVTLRNKTKGHGIILTETASKGCGNLGDALLKFKSLFRFFECQWVYLHKTYAGVNVPQPWGYIEDPSIDEVKTSLREVKTSLNSGVYLYLDGIFKCVELMHSDFDIIDVFIANGDYKKGSNEYEVLSYITGSFERRKLSDNLSHSQNLPSSETSGKTDLQETDNCLHNLPPKTSYYVGRRELEVDLKSLLLNEFTRIVTLGGLGGIGKTTLALQMLHELMSAERFLYMLWFSSRDRDLFDAGPTPVRPDVSTVDQIAKRYDELVNPEAKSSSEKDLIQQFAAALQARDGDPTLFVFDNFETLSNLSEIYDFIWKNIRSPNKVLLTTRHRQTFEEDFRINVPGMTVEQSELLIEKYSARLAMRGKLTTEQISRVVGDSAGHPYVIRLMLSEFARSGSIPKGLGRNELALEALFDRTYPQLSDGARRVFLTLSDWSTCFAELAVELVLNHHGVRFAVLDAIRELEQMSLVEIRTVNDEERFLIVPAPARLFGRGKLKLSPANVDVSRDLKLLKWFGDVHESQVRLGVMPLVVRFLKCLDDVVRQAELHDRGDQVIDDYSQLLRNLGSMYPECCLEIASLFTDRVRLDDETHFVETYIDKSQGPEIVRAWKWLAAIQGRKGSRIDELSIMVPLAEREHILFSDLSSAAHLHGYIVGKGLFTPSERGKLEELAHRLIVVMGNRIREAKATDCSRLAWMCHFVRDFDQSRQWCEWGLSLEPWNPHCRGLLERLEAQEAGHRVIGMANW